MDIEVQLVYNSLPENIELYEYHGSVDKDKILINIDFRDRETTNKNYQISKTAVEALVKRYGRTSLKTVPIVDQFGHKLLLREIQMTPVDLTIYHLSFIIAKETDIIPVGIQVVNATKTDRIFDIKERCLRIPCSFPKYLRYVEVIVKSIAAKEICYVGDLAKRIPANLEVKLPDDKLPIFS